MVPSRAGQRIPTSYVMELITIHLWEKNQTEYGTFDTLKAFRDVMKALQDFKSLNVVWEKNYTKAMIPRHVEMNRYRGLTCYRIHSLLHIHFEIKGVFCNLIG